MLVSWLTLVYGRPDGKKKAYVRLTADHDALEVANKVCCPTCLGCGADVLFRLASSE